MSNLIDKDETIKEIMGQPPEPHYPDWYADIVRKMPELSCDGCVYNDAMMIYADCVGCVRMGIDNYTAEEGDDDGE